MSVPHHHNSPGLAVLRGANASPIVFWFKIRLNLLNAAITMPLVQPRAQPHSRVMPPWRRNYGAAPRGVMRLVPDCTKGDNELKCRLALAQFLKDIDNPLQPPADFVTAAVSALFEEMIQGYRQDLLDILLGICVSSGDRSVFSRGVLRRSCSPRTEEFAKRLVYEGYDWRTLKKKLSTVEKWDWSCREEVPQRILTYGREGGVQVVKTVWSGGLLKLVGRVLTVFHCQLLYPWVDVALGRVYIISFKRTTTGTEREAARRI